MRKSRFIHVLAATALAASLVACRAGAGGDGHPLASSASLRTHYLEIVTPEVDATCDSIAESHGVTFGPMQAELGNARTAPLAGGGLIGVRAPMHQAENSVVRPYLLVEDIESAVANAVAAGAEVMLPATPIEGRGTFAIYMLGGIEHGLWQL